MSRFQKIVVALLVLILMFSIVSAAPNMKQITAFINDSLKVTLDGQPFVAKDAKGNEVKPIVYNGSTYLPVRAVAEVTGLTVNYNNQTSTVELSSVKVQDTAQPQQSTVLPASGWKGDPSLTRVQNLTFLNANTTTNAIEDKQIKETFKRAFGLVLNSSLNPESPAPELFISDSEQIEIMYLMSELQIMAKSFGFNVILNDDIEIISLGYTSENYILADKDLNKRNEYSAVVIKASTLTTSVSEKVTSTEYFYLVRDNKDNLLKFYTVCEF
jgi:hypothetical protein